MEALPYIFAGVVVILGIVLTVVGVQLVLVLIETRRTLQHLNQVIEATEQKFSNIVQPLQNLGGIASGLGAGMRVFEAFVGWLQRTKDKDDR